MRRIASWSVYPVLMSAALVSMYLAVIAGHDPEIALVCINTIGTLVVIILERIMPYRAAWNRSHDDLTTDICHGVFSFAVIPALMQTVFASAAYSASSELSSALGFSLWPHQWPLYAQATTALLIADFGQYSIHRAFHQVPLLWRLHATHHSAPRLYWLNLGRIHPLDVMLTYSVSVILLMLLGAPTAAISLYMVCSVVHVAIQHSNVDVRLGPLNWIFSQAEVHRWHHSPDAAESNNNYGNVLLVFDVVFGTRFLPGHRQPPVNPGIGDMPDFPQDYLGQLRSPLSWHQLKRDEE